MRCHSSQQQAMGWASNVCATMLVDHHRQPTLFISVRRLDELPQGCWPGRLKVWNNLAPLVPHVNNHQDSSQCFSRFAHFLGPCDMIVRYSVCTESTSSASGRWCVSRVPPSGREVTPLVEMEVSYSGDGPTTLRLFWP